jgi:tetratricopeptide (TPR) repeat protein
LKAKIAWAQGDLPTVGQELERARTLGYPSHEMVGLYGLFLARANSKSDAEPYLRRAFDTSSKLDPDVAEALARLYLGSFRLAEAALVLDRWLREKPGDALPYLLRSEIDTRSHADPDLIIARLEAALERDPGLDQARLGLAEQLRRNYRFTEAAPEYSAYIARKPGDPSGYTGAGQNALDMGNDIEAGRLLDRALALAPTDSEALAARATVELHQGRFEAALKYYDRAVKSDPFDHANRYQRMLILVRLGKEVEATAEREVAQRLKDELKRFNQISRDLLKNPHDSQLRSEAARWLMDHGHEDEAVDWANLVLRADPAHPAMNRLLADYYRTKGELGLANYHETHAAPHPNQ